MCVLGVVFYFMTAEERLRAGRDAALYLEGDPQRDPFLAALRDRTRYALATPALTFLCVLAFLPVLFDASRASDTAGLVGLGGNFAPRTTNGEWVRLLKSVFVHSGLLHFAVTLAGLFQFGLIVERYVGPIAFLTVFISAGVVANLIAIQQNPLSASVGPSAAIFGVYGLFISSTAWAVVAKSPLRISLDSLKRIAPAAGVFALYSLVAGQLSSRAELVGLMVGLASGAFLGRTIGESKPSLRHVAITAATSMVIAVGGAFLVRGVDDVRPEIAKVIIVEEETSGTYDAALHNFRNGRLAADALAAVIDRRIVPELQAADARLKAFDKVPEAHQPLVADAVEYLRLRSKSWRLRADALRTMGTIVGRKSAKPIPAQAVTLTFREADRIERDSLASLRKIKPEGS
jgi:rhomboid protease GluP